MISAITYAAARARIAVAIAAALMSGLVPSVVYSQADVGSLPAVSAPSVYGDAVNTGLAASSSTQRALSPPAGITGDVDLGLALSVKFGATWHSNPEREDESDNDVALVANPSLGFGGNLGRHPFRVGYSAGTQRYDQYDTLDSDFQKLDGAIRFDMTRILITDLYGSHVEAQEQPGTSGSRDTGPGQEPDDFTIDTVGGRVTLGRRSNLLQIYLGAETNSIEFTNNNQGIRDRDEDWVEGGLFFNVGPKTALFLHGRQTDYDYLQGDPSTDNTEESVTLGVTWEASSAISLTFEAGNLTKEYDDPTIEGFDGDTYLGKLRWQPRNRTSLSFYASRTTEESSDSSGFYFVSEVAGADLTQRVGERGSVTLHYATANDEYDFGREDDITDYGIAFGYGLLTWMNLGLSYNVIERDSNDPEFQFEDEVISVFVSISPSLGGDD